MTDDKLIAQKTPKSSNMPELAIAGAFLAIGVAVSTLVGRSGHIAIAALIIAIAVVFVITALLLDKLTTAAWITSALCSPKPPTLYNMLLDAAMPRFRAALHINEPQEGDSALTLLRDAFTYRLLDRAMLIAVIYPILLLLLYWGLTGQAGTLGEVEIIPAVDEYWKGTVTLCGIALVILVFSMEPWAAASPKRFVRSVSGWLGIVAFLAFGGLVQLIDLPPVATAVATALATAFAVERLLKRGSRKGAVFIELANPFLMAILALWFVPWANLQERTGPVAAIFLFFGVLPIVNAVYDTFSYGITLALTERGRRRWAILWGVLDAFVALILFLALGATLVVVVAGMQSISGVSFADLPTLLSHKIDMGRYWWLYAMLFSTALPTLLHLGLACLSLQALIPLTWREKVALLVPKAHEGVALDGVNATFVIGSYFVAGLALPLLALYSQWLVLWGWFISGFVDRYRDILVDLFVWITI